MGHLEAGLHVHLRYRPFPNVMNRRLLGRLGTCHLASTERAATVLRRQGIPAERILVSGNPVIDALRWINSRPPAQRSLLWDDRLKS